MSGRHAFIAHFLLLSVVSGITIGMGKVVTTFFALHTGASAMQVGFISAMESLGMLLVTVPAGFLISRFGARRIYFISSLGPALLSLALPWLGVWYGIALARGLIGLCIPFRIVSMNSSFLEELKKLGSGKAGWYRGALTLGIGFLGPLLGNAFTQHTSYAISYSAIGALFAFMAFYSQVFLPGPRADTATQSVDEGGIFSQVRAMLANVEIGESCLLEFISSSTTSLFSTFILLIAMDVAHLPQERAIWLMLVQGATTVGSLFLLGPLLGGLGRRRAYGVSLICGIGGLLLLGFGANFGALAAGTVSLGVAAALVHLVNMAQLSRHTMNKSKISGLYNLAQMSGGFTGALIGGVLSHFFALQQLFLVWIPVLLLTALVCRLRVARRENVVAAVPAGD